MASPNDQARASTTNRSVAWDDDEAAGAACAAVARANQQERLDGRWRSRELAATIGVPAQRLDAELGRLADANDAPVPGG